MRIGIFSDTHLTARFDRKRAEFLTHLIQSFDQIIIAGDLWDGNFITFDQFIHSQWNTLFPLLKEKKTVYIYGNHDPQDRSDERVSLFSDIQKMQYTFSSGNKTFVVEHGDRLNHSVQEFFHSGFGRYLSDHYLGKYINPEELIVKIGGKRLHTKLCSRFNTEIKEIIPHEFLHDEILICGHTHAQELTDRFVNTGIIR